MMIKKPTLVKGTRDHDALQLYKRNYIFDTLRNVYQKYGFQILETPAIEDLITLTEKYGDEGEQLVFKILNSGNFLAEVTDSDSVLAQDCKKILPQIVNKGLRYDLTVPLIRYIVMNQHQLIFPFRRYQMQPVWRADRPQKGRYREFYQCDADIVGTTSLICEAEILNMIYEVLNKLNINHFCIKVNHRGILKAISGSNGLVNQEHAFCMAVDKLSKIGVNRVVELLVGQGCSPAVIENFKTICTLQGSNEEKLALLKTYLGSDNRGTQAISDLVKIFNHATHLGLNTAAITIDPTLARGLAYYTGMIIEVSVHNSGIGSIGGGGRYDNLADFFGLKGLSGIGFSFGIDRLYDIMEVQNLFDLPQQYTTQVMITNMDACSEKISLHLLAHLRAKSIRSEIYPTYTKLKNQLNYADKKKIPFVVILGSEEQALQQYTLKNMETGEQVKYDLSILLYKLMTLN